MSRLVLLITMNVSDKPHKESKYRNFIFNNFFPEIVAFTK